MQKTSAEVVLEVDQVVQRFGGVTALQGVSIAVRECGVHAVIGPNGAGKTTLFNIVTGLQVPTSGRVLLRGEDVTAMRPDRVARKGISRTFQNVRVFRGMSVLDNVLVGGQSSLARRRPGRMFRSRSLERQLRLRARELLSFVGLAEVADRPAASLPLAEQRRLEVARALASDPAVVLLDEPAAGMNAAEKDEIAALVQDVVRMSKAVILVEHDMRIVMGLADWVSVISFGELIADGSPEDVQRDPAVIAAYLGGES